MLIQQTVHLASNHFIGIQFVNTIVLGVSAGATKTMVALLGVVSQRITKLITKIKKDMNAFAVSTSVLLVTMKHTVLHVRTIIGVDNAVIAVTTAMVLAIRTMDV